MKILVRDFRDEPLKLQVNAAPGELELADADYTFNTPVTGEVEFHPLADSSKVYASGHLETTAEAECVRCLGHVTIPIRATVRALYENNEELLKPEHGLLGKEDESISYFDGEQIDRAPQFREALLLELPSLPHCSEDCRGLCPKCGVNRNTTPCDCPTSEAKIDAWKDALRKIKL